MFEPTEQPRVFAQHPGVDFPQAIVDGLRARLAGQPPEKMAEVHLIVNTLRMSQRVRELFETGPPGFLPKIILVSDLGDFGLRLGIPPAIPPLRRRLQILQLVRGLLDQQPDLAGRDSLFDLADSLADLLEEMESEGISPSRIEQLDISDQSGHWERAKIFIRIVQSFFDSDDAGLSLSARQRRVIEKLRSSWQREPIDHPIILAGSTGSRGSTLMLMDTISRLPQGALILPGFDYALPAEVWHELEDPLTSEDHPQFRFRQLLTRLGLTHEEVPQWHHIDPPCPARNKVLCLALRPAPVTDAWLEEGNTLDEMEAAFANVTLVEAFSPLEEALAIALRMRLAAEKSERVALITPDHTLSRLVAAALDRWDITPNVGSGEPLHLTPTGLFLRHIAAAFCQPPTSTEFLTILKHPLTHSGSHRGEHMQIVRRLETHLRRGGHIYPNASDIASWCSSFSDLPTNWLQWLTLTLLSPIDSGQKSLCDWCNLLIEYANRLADGSSSVSGLVWALSTGKKAKDTVDALLAESDFGGMTSAVEFADLLLAILSREQVRRPFGSHLDIMIWGTLEARAQGCDAVLLGGLNDGIWPSAIQPDPWLNRKMRKDAGLLLPERRIGLSAQDFQQAIAAPEVWLTRSIRSDNSQTVPSRWLNRMTNLLDGLPDQGGKSALAQMRSRGDIWLAWTRQLDTPKSVSPAARPSPCPPVGSRPKKLSVTEIKTLIRDPYAIYARHILRLRPLNPLSNAEDPRVRGTIVHNILEEFVSKVATGRIPLNTTELFRIADDLLLQSVSTAVTRLVWRAQISRFADWFVEEEQKRRQFSDLLATEVAAVSCFEGFDFVLTARADRIDKTHDGNIILYDYKSGTPPSQKQQSLFDKQLLLEALMVESGDFDGIPASKIIGASYIGLGTKHQNVAAPLDQQPLSEVRKEFEQLITSYAKPSTGYTARSRVARTGYPGDYDQLARFGEWDDTMPPAPEVVE
ncbi:MAG: double-strand break repair protein AddB [Aestuariivita sp.]|nr:double-strand break repair protein AddB [Aestuariivita sp.]